MHQQQHVSRSNVSRLGQSRTRAAIVVGSVEAHAVRPPGLLPLADKCVAHPAENGVDERKHDLLHQPPTRRAQRPAVPLRTRRHRRCKHRDTPTAARAVGYHHSQCAVTTYQQHLAAHVAFKGGFHDNGTSPADALAPVVGTSRCNGERCLRSRSSQPRRLIGFGRQDRGQNVDVATQSRTPLDTLEMKHGLPSRHQNLPFAPHRQCTPIDSSLPPVNCSRLLVATIPKKTGPGGVRRGERKAPTMRRPKGTEHSCEDPPLDGHLV